MFIGCLQLKTYIFLYIFFDILSTFFNKIATQSCYVRFNKINIIICNIYF